MSAKITLVVLLIIIVAAIVGVSVWFWPKSNTNPNSPTQAGCTMEAKMCPDGSGVSRSGPHCEFAACPSGPVIGSAVDFTIGKQVTFDDGLIVALTAINDSRCKEGVVCIWAGELAPVLYMTDDQAGIISREVQLGTTTKPQVNEGGYVFLLNSATETKANITVSKGAEAQIGCYVGGCSSEICSDKEGTMSTCMFKPEYGCYKNAVCEKQKNGKCGWTQNSVLTACLNASK